MTDAQELNESPGETMLNKLFDEFNAQYGIDTKPVDHKLNKMHQLIADEVDELLEETDSITTVDIQAVIKESIDIIYITCQQLRERGVNIDAALAEVHRSNMSKALDLYDSKVAYSELECARNRYPNAKLETHGNKFILKCADSGKVIKPTTYSEAEITPDMID